MSERLEHPDLEHADSVEFDWPSLERALGELPADDAVEALADALGKIVAWLCEPVTNRKYEHTPGAARLGFVGRRAAVLQWILRPESFGNRSLQNVADELGVKPERLHELSAEFSRKFGLKNRQQISRASSIAARAKPVTA